MTDKTKKNIFVITFSLLLSAMFVFFIYSLMFLRTEPVKDKVGTVTVKKGTCYVYQSDKDKWFKVKNICSVIKGNSIKTDLNSSCDLYLFDGTRILLHENSLIKISEDNNTRLILSGNGKITADTIISSGNIRIKTDNQNEMILEKSSVASIKVSGLDVDCIVAEGRMVVLAGENVEKSAVGGSGFTMNEEGVMTRKPLIIKAPLPEFFIQNKINFEKVKFTWKKNNLSVGFVKIQVSQDKTFKSGVKDYIENADKGFTYIPVEKGTTFWRAFVLDKQGNVLKGTGSHSGKIHFR